MHDDDDLDLATRFAAVDIVPRSQWVAGLRADLEASWDTGELPQEVAGPARPRSPWRWPERRTWVLVAAAVAVTIALVLVVTDGVRHTVTPTNEPTTDVDSTVRATLAPAPAVVPSTQPTTASSGGVGLCHQVGRIGPAEDPATVQIPGGGEFIAYTAAEFWRVTPISCTEGGRVADSFDATSTPFDPALPGTTLHVDFATIESAAPGVTLGPSSGFPGVWGDLAVIGVTDTAMFLRTDSAIIRVDLADASVSAVGFDPAAPQFPTTYATAVCVVDDFAVVDRFGNLDRADFATGTLRPWAANVPAACPGTQPTAAAIIPAPPTDLTYLDPATQLVTRIASDGTKTTTPRVPRQLFIMHPGPSTLWALTVAEGAPFNPMDPATPAHLSRIDPITGEVIVTLDPNPPDSFCPSSYRAYVNDDGILAVCGAEHLWWVTNDGLSIALAPLPGEPIGLEGNLVLLQTADGGYAAVDLHDYLSSTP